MKYLSIFLLLTFLLACNCDNQTLSFKGKLLSGIDSISPMPDYILNIRYYKTGKSGPGGCHDYEKNTSIRTNSLGDFSLTLETTKREFNYIIIRDSLSHIIYDSILYNDLGNLYTTP